MEVLFMSENQNKQNRNNNNNKNNNNNNNNNNNERNNNNNCKQLEIFNLDKAQGYKAKWVFSFNK